jgi:hypothetical protein
MRSREHRQWDHNGQPKEKSTLSRYVPFTMMNREQNEFERQMVPIADRCFRGCGTRAVLVEDFSAFCAKCALAVLQTEAKQRPSLAA